MVKKKEKMIIGILGGLALFIYGTTQTLQPTNFEECMLHTEGYSFFHLLCGVQWWIKRNQIDMKFLVP